MFAKRIFCLAAALCCLLGLSSGARALEVDCDSSYCFSAGDFSAEDSFAGICVMGIPQEGSVTLGTRIIQPGDILTADQIAGLTFNPLRSESDRDAVLTYLPIFEDHVAQCASMTIAVRGKQNQAPVAEDSALETYKNLPNEAMLKVKDPEGEAMTYTVTRQPKRGTVAIREDGSFIYTPNKNKVGVDSFTYTAADAAGNVSREATVTITILKPTDSQQYADTAGESCRFAAEWMKNTGIFVAERVSGNSCFRPGKEVSRGEFLTMLVGALDIPVDENAEFTGYTDESPTWLKPYLAAAMRSGLTTGWPEGDTFDAEAAITGAEAAVMVQNAMTLSPAEEVETVVEEAAPAWAADALTVLSTHGISLNPEAALTRGEAAQMMYQLSRLAYNAPGVTVFNTAQ
ncbi:MAG: S-layer homology domain-containing protein [Oscillospiraceae bacterium]|nr:S-layer homology domain-containing protein [Oscillospiraceae bacterium]